MRTSLYLTLAVWLIKADINKQETEWKRTLRRNRYHLPFHSEHLMRDVGFDKTGRPISGSAPTQIVAERKVHHIRRVLYSRLIT